MQAQAAKLAKSQPKTFHSQGTRPETAKLTGGVKGTIHITYYHRFQCPEKAKNKKANRGMFPMLILLGIANGFTAGVRLRMMKCAALLGSYEEAVQMLADEGIKICVNMLRKVTAGMGEMLARLTKLGSCDQLFRLLLFLIERQGETPVTEDSEEPPVSQRHRTCDHRDRAADRGKTVRGSDDMEELFRESRSDSPPDGLSVVGKQNTLRHAGNWPSDAHKPRIRPTEHYSMKFTVVFPSHESSDLSLAAVFIPCLLWMEGNNEILNPHPDDPVYRKGDLKKVLALKTIRSRISSHAKTVSVVAHCTGHGTRQNLDDLVCDLRDERFEVNVINQ